MFSQRSGLTMSNKIIHYSKWHHGYLVQLVQIKKDYYVLLGFPKGGIYTQKFSTLEEADEYRKFMINGLNKFFLGK